MKGFIHCESLPNGCNIAANLYYLQLHRVADKLKRKQDRIYFLYNNARPHVAKSIRQKLLDLEWTTVPHLPYSLGLAPMDHHLYHSLSSHLRQQSSTMKMTSKRPSSTKILKASTSTGSSLYQCWQQVIGSNVAYVIER